MRRIRPKKIISILFVGNDSTQESVLRREMVISEDQPYQEALVEQSRQNMMDLGLFKSVDVSTKPTDGGFEITFEIDEKRFWYIVPVFSRGSDGDITWGGRLQMDNLLGLNNMLTVRAKRKDFQDTDIQVEESLEVEYSYPRMFGSPYDLFFAFDYDEADIEETRGVLVGDYLREKVSYGFSISKWLAEEGPSKGLRLSLGLRSDVFDHEYLRGDPNLFSDLTVNSLVAALEYKDVIELGNARSGRHYGLVIEQANSTVGSDVTHTAYNLFFPPLRQIENRDTV